MFMMIGGYPPFFDEDDAQLFNLIKKGDVRYAVIGGGVKGGVG